MFLKGDPISEPLPNAFRRAQHPLIKELTSSHAKDPLFPLILTALDRDCKRGTIIPITERLEFGGTSQGIGLFSRG